MLKVRDDVEICRCARLLFVGKSLLVAFEEVILVGRLQFLDTGAYSVSNYVFTCEVIIKKNSSSVPSAGRRKRGRWRNCVSCQVDTVVFLVPAIPPSSGFGCTARLMQLSVSVSKR